MAAEDIYAEKLLQLRLAALSQIDGTDSTALLKFIQAEYDGYRIKRDNRRSELEKRLAEFRDRFAKIRSPGSNPG